MFRTVPLSIIRNFFYYTNSSAVCHTGLLTACEQDQDGSAVPSWSCSQAVSKPVWHIPLLGVQCKTPGDGQRNCPKHVEFYSKNKFEKLVYRIGFIIRTNGKLNVFQFSQNMHIFLRSILLLLFKLSYMVYFFLKFPKSLRAFLTFFSACPMSLSPYLPWFNSPDDDRWKLKIMKLLFMPFFRALASSFF